VKAWRGIAISAWRQWRKAENEKANGVQRREWRWQHAYACVARNGESRSRGGIAAPRILAPRTAHIGYCA